MACATKTTKKAALAARMARARAARRGRVSFLIVVVLICSLISQSKTTPPASPPLPPPRTLSPPPPPSSSVSVLLSPTPQTSGARSPVYEMSGGLAAPDSPAPAGPVRSRRPTPCPAQGRERGKLCLRCVRSALAKRSNGVCYNTVTGGSRCWRCVGGHQCLPCPPGVMPLALRLTEALVSGASKPVCDS